MIAVIAGTASGLTGEDPVCRPITGASEQGPVDKGFQQIDGMSILFLPVRADAMGNPGEDMAGQMGNLNPRQDEKTHVVRQIPQVAFPIFFVPRDEGIPRRRLPGSGAKQKTGQGTALGIPNEIFDIFSYGAPVTQVMVLRQQPVKQRTIL